MKMDEKLKRDGSNGSSLRTLAAINGKFETMGIDGRSLNAQSCDKEASGIRDANGDVWHKGFCGRSSVENSSRELNGVIFHSANGKLTENSAGIETHTRLKNKNKAQCPRASSFSKRASVVGRHGRDSEIDVFDAEKYFSSTYDESLADQMEKPVGSSNPHLDIEPVRVISTKGACRGLPSDVSVIEEKPSTQLSSAASSLNSKAVISESNNHSGLLSNAASSIFNGLPLNQRAGEPKHKWRIACKCPCATKKSIAISDSLLDQSGKIASLSSSVQSSPLRSNYSGLHSNSSRLSTDFSLSPELDKLKFKKSYRSEKIAGVKDLNSGNEIPATSSGSLVRLQRDEEVDMRIHAKSRQFKRMESRGEDGIQNSSENQGEGFSFPTLPSPSTHSAVFSFPEEKPRLSLQVFGLAPDSNEKQSTNTQRRRRLLSADMADNSSDTRSSFSFPRLSFCSCESFDNRDVGFDNGYNHGAMKLDNNPNTVEDDKSDSSSDLFELESLSTDASVPCTIYKTAINHVGIELKGYSHSSSCQTSATVDPWHRIHHAQVTKLLSSGIANVRKEYSTSLDKHCMNNLDIMSKRSEEKITSPSIANDSPTEFSMPIRSGILLGSRRKDKTAHAVTAPVSPQLTKPTQQQLNRTSCRTAQQDLVYGRYRPPKPR